MEKMRQILMSNNLKMHAYMASEVSFEMKAVKREATPRGGSKGSRLCHITMRQKVRATIKLWLQVYVNFHLAELILVWIFVML